VAATGGDTDIVNAAIGAQFDDHSHLALKATSDGLWRIKQVLREFSLGDLDLASGHGFGLRNGRSGWSERRGWRIDLRRLFWVDGILEQGVGSRHFRQGRQAQRSLQRRTGRGNRKALQDVRKEQRAVHSERKRKSENQTERH